mmetsp:Transcript_13527/g.29053  ORF Transcript_13527/g.29053 Transcript_13527/m.29053 type:complete len:84 (+) Transcript_13527:3137-3388(+)
MALFSGIKMSHNEALSKHSEMWHIAEGRTSKRSLNTKGILATVYGHLMNCWMVLCQRPYLCFASSHISKDSVMGSPPMQFLLK